jgi:hypothetical protein
VRPTFQGVWTHPPEISFGDGGSRRTEPLLRALSRSEMRTTGPCDGSRHERSDRGGAGGDLNVLLTGFPPEARPVIIKMAMQHVLHLYEQCMQLEESGAEKKQIEMAMRDLRAQLIAFERECREELPE